MYDSDIAVLLANKLPESLLGRAQQGPEINFY